MLAIKIWNYIKGYVIIRIKGLTLERLLNLALSKDIYLRNVNRLDSSTLEGTVSLEGYRALEEIVQKLGCEMEVVKRRGLPFFLDRIRYRKTFIFGLMLFIVLSIFLSSIIWKIEIIGAEQTPKEEIIKLLEENNIKKGLFKHRIDKEEVEGIILAELDYLSFIDVRINGVKLIVEIKELDIDPERVDSSYPCNIVARKKGVVVKVIAKNGEALVEKGEIVEENDVLISGVIESENSDEIYLVHAEGQVLAQTRYSHMVETPIVKLEKVETGNVYKQRGIIINGKGIRFLSGEIPFENYIEEVEEKSIFNFLGFEFPIKFVNYIYREVEVKEIKQDIDFLKQASKLEATEEINKQLHKSCEIISRNAIYTIDGNILRTKVTIETIEDIGKIQIISN
ncbi:MAG: sporulation protein YqfD [Tissierellia bacterium]|nr:sporulation protein YqfD [Tissierellia bacterium]